MAIALRAPSAKSLVSTSGRRSTVIRGRARLAVYEYGDAQHPTVVLVHGWPDTHHLWSAVIPLLADRFHVVAYDVRGQGESTAPKRIRDFRLEELAADLFAVIAAVSPEAPAHVVAHDWGSISAWEAVCEPGAETKVASFTSISGPNLDHVALWMRKRFENPTLRNLFAPLSQVASELYSIISIVPGAARIVFSVLGFPSLWAGFLRITEGMPREKLYLANTLRSDMVSGRRYYSANLMRRMLRPRARYTSVPVQLLINTRDVAVRKAGYEDTEKWVKTLRRKEFPTGHWLPYSHPNIVAREATAFIDELAECPNR